MTIPFTRWPEDFARRYREKGYWQDLPLTHILTDHADNVPWRLSTAIGVSPIVTLIRR